MQETMLKNSWSSLTTWWCISNCNSKMTIRIPPKLWFYNQSKEIGSLEMMGKKLCFRVNNFELWSMKKALLPMISHCHSPPPTHCLIPQLNDTNVKKKTWPTKSNNSKIMTQEDYNIRGQLRESENKYQRFQGYFPSSHIIFIMSVFINYLLQIPFYTVYRCTKIRKVQCFREFIILERNQILNY